MAARPADDEADIPRPERDWERGESPPSATIKKAESQKRLCFFMWKYGGFMLFFAAEGGGGCLGQDDD